MSQDEKMRHVRFFSDKTPLLLSGVSLVRFFPLVERNEHKKTTHKSKFEHFNRENENKFETEFKKH